MKKYLLLFLMLFLCLPLISSAEIKEGSFEVSPFAGYSFFQSNDLSNRPVYGLRLGYNITKNWGVEAGYSYFETRASIFQGNVLYHFMPDKSFNPFITAGLGHAYVKPRHEGDNYNTIMGDIGIGAKYFITP